MPPNPRVMIFVDGNNFYFGLRRLGLKLNVIDFRKLAHALMMTGRDHIKTFFYIAAVDQKEVPDLYKDQQRLFSDLKSQGVELRLGYLQNKIIRCLNCDNEYGGGIKCPTCGHVFGKKQEKGVDVFLASDLVYHAAANDYDIAYLITSDGDQAESCKRVISLGKRVFYVCLPPESIGLEHACSGRIKKGTEFYRKCMI